MISHHWPSDHAFMQSKYDCGAEAAVQYHLGRLACECDLLSTDVLLTWKPHGETCMLCDHDSAEI